MYLDCNNPLQSSEERRISMDVFHKTDDSWRLNYELKGSDPIPKEMNKRIIEEEKNNENSGSNDESDDK
jgi:hypothetical protein